MNNIIISPSILSADFVNLEKDIKRIEKTDAKWLHVDVMDGHFVPNITIGIPVVKAIRKITNLFLDVHLMIENPEKYVEDFAKAGADLITIHYEAAKENTQNIIDKIHSLGILAGLSIKPNTDVSLITDYIDSADLILVMTVEPGFGGQKFIEECAEKLPKIKKLQNEKQYLEVDGGINETTVKICKQHGANVIVAGNYLFSSDNIQEKVSILKY